MVLLGDDTIMKYSRHFRATGFYNAELIASRDMTEIEDEAVKEQYRLNYYRYDCWEQLIEDEKLFYPGHPEWIEKLRELSKEHHAPTPEGKNIVYADDVLEKEAKANAPKLIQGSLF